MTTELILPERTQALQAFSAINQFQEIARSQMREGHDFGVIPGTTKPTLLKPGAEKIAKILGLADQYEIIDRQEDWNKPFFRYLIKCMLISVSSGVIISEGLGECNSMEAKYRWREAKRKCPVCGAEAIIKGKAEYGGGWLCFTKMGGCGKKWNDGDQSIESQETGRVENDDVYTQVNTILKMAKKRALVDAALSAGRLSELFTQDIEDMAMDIPYEVTPTASPEAHNGTPKPEPKPPVQPKAQSGQKKQGAVDSESWKRYKAYRDANPALTDDMATEILGGSPGKMIGNGVSPDELVERLKEAEPFESQPEMLEV